MKEKLDESVRKSVESYVYDKYKDFKGKDLTILDLGGMFKVQKNSNGGSLFLSKSILD